MMSFNVLKHIGLQTQAVKFVSSISNQTSLRRISYCKFNSKNYAKDKFKKYAHTIGYGVGITLFLKITFSKVKQRHKVYDEVNYAFSDFSKMTIRNCYCEALPSFHTETQVSSLRRSFNFIADTVEKTQNSVVYIEINARHPFTGAHMPISNGSGFIVRSDGLILTNAHVVIHYGEIIVQLYDGTTYYGMVEDIDTESDLAIVRITAENLPVLPFGSSSEIRNGEFVIAMGNPFNLSHTITAGVVSSTNRNGEELGLHEKTDYIQTDATIHIGNSGGPLVNLDGEVIGINTLKVTDGISFAIPSDRAIEFLKKSEEKSKRVNSGFFRKPIEKKKHKFLGISMVTLSPRVARELKEYNPDFASVDQGALVWRVMIGSPSYEAGIKPGDIITQVNKIDVKSAETVMDFLEKEDVLHLTLKRNQQTFNVIVYLVEPVMP